MTGERKTYEVEVTIEFMTTLTVTAVSVEAARKWAQEEARVMSLDAFESEETTIYVVGE